MPSYPTAPDVAVSGAAPSQSDKKKKKKKKDRLKIDKDVLGLSNRVVFTDDGRAVAGLDLLGHVGGDGDMGGGADGGMGGGGGGGGGDMGDGGGNVGRHANPKEGLDVGEHGTAAERFLHARRVLMERDKADREMQVRGWVVGWGCVGLWWVWGEGVWGCSEVVKLR